MDASSETRFSDPLTVLGSGSVIASDNTSLDVLPWLKNRKMKKFMGKQDQMAVIAAGSAARSAGLSEEDLRCRTGIYLCVGYIPFEKTDVEAIALNSSTNGQFSMELFSTKGFEEVNPLLTFRCLPNMPMFHISLNLNVNGPYFVTYPGPAQFYSALELACSALQQGEVDFALVGGVADQNNFLVQHHYKRCGFDGKQTPDAAAFICLTKHSLQGHRRLFDLQIDFTNQSAANLERWNGTQLAGYYGAASLPLLLDLTRDPGHFEHTLQSTDGIEARSSWIVE